MNDGDSDLYERLRDAIADGDRDSMLVVADLLEESGYDIASAFWRFAYKNGLAPMDRSDTPYWYWTQGPLTDGLSYRVGSDLFGALDLYKDEFSGESFGTFKELIQFPTADDAWEALQKAYVYLNLRWKRDEVKS